jgi:hypothetical protein
MGNFYVIEDNELLKKENLTVALWEFWQDLENLTSCTGNLFV